LVTRSQLSTRALAIEPGNRLRALHGDHARQHVRINDMNIYSQLIVVLWLILLAYWAISAISAKKSLRAGLRWRTEAAARLVILVLVLLAIRVPVLRRALHQAQSDTPSNTLVRICGVVLCALGIGVAIWARASIGRNWGMPMSRKENPELVTTGPYSFIRHPIYSGILIAMLGCAVSVSILWLLPLIFFGAYFIYSARREERIMVEEFPEQYPAYMRRTKMILPFVL
jgi:protein-S-isoprenylcysteine O-methyltransferase Ste14